MTSKSYYCNKCKKTHYSHGHVYHTHLRSSNSPRKKPGLQHPETIEIKIIKRTLRLLKECNGNLDCVRKKMNTEYKDYYKKMNKERVLKHFTKNNSPKKKHLTLKTLHQYPYNVQRGVQMWLNIMRWKLTDIKELIYSRGGSITLIDQKDKRHQFDVS